jgi:hypothetical protein
VHCSATMKDNRGQSGTVVQDSALQCRTIKDNGGHGGIVQYSILQCRMLKERVGQCSPVQDSTGRYKTVQDDTARRRGGKTRETAVHITVLGNRVWLFVSQISVCAEYL